MKNPGMIFLMFLLACNSSSNVSPDTPKDSVPPVPNRPSTKDTTTLAGTWYLEPVPPTDTTTAELPRIRFVPEVGRFNGFTGCNAMRGTFYFSRKDSSISFGDKIVVGRKLCRGYNESALLSALKRTGRFQLHNDVLLLTTDSRTQLTRWRRARSVPRGKPG
ncbi:MAG TPA: META domain-containing protein [Puia sp.]|nr:META domain-containing protein [Puia sp.]